MSSRPLALAALALASALIASACAAPSADTSTVSADRPWV